MPLTALKQVEQENAQLATLSLVTDAASAAGDDLERIMVIGNSMIAAAKILFEYYSIDRKQQAELYREFWSPLVQSGGIL